MNIEQQLFAIEGASMNKNIFDGLRQGNAVLQQAHRNINIDEVEQLKEDMEEQQDLLQEMNEAISQPIGFMSTVDDDELMEELDDLEAQEYEAGLLDMDAPPEAVPEQRLPEPEQRVPEQRAQEAPPQQGGDELDDLFNQLQMG